MSDVSTYIDTIQACFDDAKDKIDKAFDAEVTYTPDRVRNGMYYPALVEVRITVDNRMDTVIVIDMIDARYPNLSPLASVDPRPGFSVDSIRAVVDTIYERRL